MRGRLEAEFYRQTYNTMVESISNLPDKFPKEKNEVSLHAVLAVFGSFLGKEMIEGIWRDWNAFIGLGTESKGR